MLAFSYSEAITLLSSTPGDPEERDHAFFTLAGQCLAWSDFSKVTGGMDE